MKAQDENKNGVVVGGVHFIVIVIIIYKKLNRKKILVFSFLSFQSTGHLVVVIGVLRINGF